MHSHVRGARLEGVNSQLPVGGLRRDDGPVGNGDGHRLVRVRRQDLHVEGPLLTDPEGQRVGCDLNCLGLGRWQGRGQRGLAQGARIRAIDRAIHNSDHLTGLAVYLTVQGEHGPTEREVYHRGAFNNRFRVRAGYLVSTLKAGCWSLRHIDLLAPFTGRDSHSQRRQPFGIPIYSMEVTPPPMSFAATVRS